MTAHRDRPADEIVVYYQPGCPFGLQLRAGLRLRRVPFRSIRFRDDEVGAQAVRTVNGGSEISPTVLIEGRWLTNPTAAQVQRAASAAGAG